jgi:hypothetical protein
MPAASISQGASRAARTGAARGARARTGARGRPAPLGPAARVRWDRLGRLAMGLVVLALVYLYLSAGLRMLSTVGQARHDSAAVVALEHENVQLSRQHEALMRRGTLEDEARGLGMTKSNERQYLISGLPSD